MATKRSQTGRPAAKKKSPASVVRSPKRAAASSYGSAGDVACVPIKRGLFGFVHILEMRTKQSGIVALFPVVSAECSAEPVESPATSEDQFQIELTGLAWDHWKVVGHRQPQKPAPRVDRGTSPCFVAEINIVAALKKRSLLPREFRLYEDVAASHPKLRPGIIEKLNVVMRFLAEHDLLSKEGKATTFGKSGADCHLTSDLMTSEGARFYDRVFEKDYVMDHFLIDTRAKLIAEWEAFKGR